MPRGGVRAAPLTPPLSSPLQNGTIDPKQGINGPPSWELGSLSREALESSGVLGRWATLSVPSRAGECLGGTFKWFQLTRERVDEVKGNRERNLLPWMDKSYSRVKQVKTKQRLWGTQCCMYMYNSSYNRGMFNFHDMRHSFYEEREKGWYTFASKHICSLLNTYMQSNGKTPSLRTNVWQKTTSPKVII